MPRRARFGIEEFASVLAAAQVGAAWALERLYLEFAGVVTAYLRVQGASEPEDLTSETFLGLFRSLPSFVGNEEEFRSWIFTIAHRRLLDERRRTARRPVTGNGNGNGGGPPDHPSETDVEAIVLHGLATQHVRALCDRLVPDQRDVLLLRLVGGLTVDQIASVLDVSPGAVKARQRRGVAALQRLLSRQAVPL